MKLSEKLREISMQHGRRKSDYDQPCKELSDSEKLCKNPLVSVRVITFNHAKYIRQCLDSIVCQETDFEYEVLIGDDCSTDGTAEICAEYQKRYPEKVRFLYSDKNLYYCNGNSLRLLARSRGKYIAVCEGDDYWVDHRRLQKQVNLIRDTDSMMCVAFTDWVYPNRVVHSNYDAKAILTADDFKRHYFHTTTYVMDRDVYLGIDDKYPNLAGRFDIQIQFCMADCGKVCLLPEVVSVYRWSGEGIATSLNQLKSYCFTARMMAELYMHGPKSERRYFAKTAMDAIDGPFLDNRRYVPILMSFSEFKDMITAHCYFARICKGDFAYSIPKKIEYIGSILLYVSKVCLQKVGIKFSLCKKV